MRILFAGSPAVAVPALEAVASVATELAVMSQPDKPVGRKKVLTPTSVSSWAQERGVTLYRPDHHEAISLAVTEFAPGIGITVAYGRILRPDVLALPAHGWWNVHFSLLPRWRGAAPVQHALLAGDTETGVSVFQLDEGMDTGPLLNQRPHPITPGITAGQLLNELSHVGAALLAETLQTFGAGQLNPAAQLGEETYAPKLERNTGRITASDTIDTARRRYQATTPEPGSFVTWGQGEHTLRVLAAHSVSEPTGAPAGAMMATPDGVGIALEGGILYLELVHPAGKKAMPAADWWRGIHQEIRIDG